MTMYAPPYALRSTTHMRGTVAAAYAWSNCAPCRMIPRHSRSRPGRYPLVSTNVITAMLKQSHHCTKRAAFCAASTSRLPALCIGWFAITPTVRSSSRPRPVTRLGAYADSQLEKRVAIEHVVDDGPHVV